MDRDISEMYEDELVEYLGHQLDEIKAITANITLDRLQEICNAERDGRCVVLPCNFDVTKIRGIIMIEYPAMIYKNTRTPGYVANCIVKNIIGFGKTEEDALNNLKESLESITEKCNVVVTPMYGFSIA